MFAVIGLCGLQYIQRQQQHLQVRKNIVAAIQFGAKLQRFAAGVGLLGAGVQHRPAVAQAGGTRAVEQVRIQARGLLGGVGAHAQSAARQQIHQLESPHVQIFARATQQRFDMLDQGRYHQLIAIAARAVKQFAPKIFDQTRLGRQNIGNMIGQYPGRHRGR